MTGGGRCNVTNNRPVDDLIAHIPEMVNFYIVHFLNTTILDIMEFFESQGVHLKRRRSRTDVSRTNKSKTIIEALVHRLNELNVTMFLANV